MAKLKLRKREGAGEETDRRERKDGMSLRGGAWSKEADAQNTAENAPGAEDAFALSGDEGAASALSIDSAKLAIINAQGEHTE
jgi:hypothetical protein